MSRTDRLIEAYEETFGEKPPMVWQICSDCRGEGVTYWGHA